MPTQKIKTRVAKTHLNPPKVSGWMIALVLTSFFGMIVLGLVSMGVITRNVEEVNRGKGPEATLAPKTP